MNRDHDNFILDPEILAGELHDLNGEAMGITLAARDVLPAMLAQYVETKDFARTPDKTEVIREYNTIQQILTLVTAFLDKQAHH